MNNANGGNIIFHFKGDTKGLSSSMGNLTKSFTLGTLAAKGISKAFQVMTQNMGDAVKRVDTMNNFPKVMSNLGISAKDSKKAIQELSDGLKGLPTPLDDGARAVQRFTSKNGDVKKSTKLFLALNNAIIAGGAPTEMQATALEQLSQAYAKGKPDMMEWRSAMSAMPAQLKQVAQAMGYVNADQLGEALRTGKVSMDDFMDTITKLNTNGVGGFKSFEQQARNSTAGIQTSIANMKTAFVRGLAEIINKVNASLKPFGGLSGVISKVGQVGEQAFKKIGSALAFVVPLLVKFGQFIAKHKTVIMVLVGAIGSLYVAFKTLMIVNTIKNAIAGFRLALSMLKIQAMLCGTSISTLKGALALLNLSFLASPVFWVIAGIVALVAVFVLLWKKCKAFRDFWTGVWNSIVQAVKPVIDTIKKTFDTQLKPALQDLMKALGELWKALQPVINFIITVVIVYIKMVIQQIKLLWQVLGPIIQFIIQALGVVINVVITVVTKVIQFITMIINAITWLVTHIQQIPGMIVNFIGKIPEYIGFVIGFIIGLIVKLLARLVQFITTDIPNFINGIVQWFAQLPGRIWTWLSQLPGKISQAISNMVNNAKKNIPKVANAIVNGFKSIPGKLMNIGKNIVKGLWNGISGLKNWVINKVKGMGKGILNGLKKALGIHSPSKAFADEVGQWIPKGIAVGIEANTDSVYKALEDMGNISSSFGLDPNLTNSMANNFSPTINTNVTVNQTQDPLGRMVNDVKTFSGGSRQDYNYGLGG